MPAVRTPPHLLWPENLEQHWVIDSTRIRTELQYEERVTRDDAVSATIAWERTNPAPRDPQAFDYGAEDLALSEH